MNAGSLHRLSVALVALAGSALAAAAGDTVEQCQGYARQAVEQAETNKRWGCGFTGDVWHNSEQEHFNYCRRVRSSTVDHHVKLRVDALNRCKTCGEYARTTKDLLRSVRDAGCNDPFSSNGTVGLPGPPERWGEGPGHFHFCMSGASLQTLAVETSARQQAVTKCGACDVYATQAEHDAETVAANSCSPPQDWHPGRLTLDRNAHFRWCISADNAFIQKEREARSGFAGKCVRCRKYSIDAAKQGRENERTRCGLLDSRWSTDENFHYQECMGWPDYDVDIYAQARLDYRDQALKRCPSAEKQAFCHRYTERQKEQRKLLASLDYNLETCSLSGHLWRLDRSAHYTECLEQNSAWAMDQEKARDSILNACGLGSKPLPPMIPLPASAQCNNSAEIHVSKCYDENQKESDYVVEGGTHSGCQVGETEEAAKTNAMIALGGPGQFSDPNDEPQPNKCTYEIDEFRGCGCNPGFGLQSYPGQQAPPPPAHEQIPGLGDLVPKPPPPAYEQVPGLADLVAKNPCRRGMTLTAAGRCGCRPGTRWNGRRCVAAPGSPVVVPSPTNTPSPGSGGSYPSQSPASQQGCPHGLYWQNGRCACPPGKALIRGYCRDVVQKAIACPYGSYGTRPNCKCRPRWQWSGARCVPMQRPTPIPQQMERQCPAGSIGHWPRCYRPQPQTPQAERQCPGGFVGHWPRCYRPSPQTSQAVRQCPVGFVGYWPRCYRPSLQTPQAVRQCPTGFVGYWPRCHRWRPQPPKCSPGSIGTWPKCGSVVR